MKSPLTGLLQIGIRYERVIPIIRDAVGKIEDEQLRLSIGMTRSGSVIPESVRNFRVDLEKSAAEKHGNSELAQRLKQDES